MLWKHSEIRSNLSKMRFTVEEAEGDSDDPDYVKPNIEDILAPHINMKHQPPLMEFISFSLRTFNPFSYWILPSSSTFIIS